MKTPCFSAALPLLATLAGCAGSVTGYPSLAPRPIEREAIRAEPAAPTAAPVPPPIAASADIAQIVARARAADTAFKTALDAAKPAIEAGRRAAEGSEAWVTGQQAYSAADAARTPIADVLAELDRRQQAAGDAGDAGEVAAIDAASTEVQAIDDAERAQLAALMPA